MEDPGKKNGNLDLKLITGGNMTPSELHRAIGIRKSCMYCGQPAAVRIRVLVALDELTRRQPEYVAQIMATNPDGSWTVPTLPTKYGPMVKVSDVGACSHCRREAEIAAARGPSWAIVEISAGPDPTNKVAAQVPVALVPTPKAS